MTAPPSEVLDAAGVAVVDVDVELLPWRVPIWKVRRGETAAVLRRSELDALCSAEDLRWQHRVQSACLDRGLPVPRPLRVFDNDTVLTHGGYGWEVLGYLPGETLGWRTSPPVSEVGATLARFHSACASLSAVGQRPSAVPLSQLSVRVDQDVIEASLPNAESGWSFRRHLDGLEAYLAALELQSDQGLIHGDFTALNLLVDGQPARISGIIDFSSAYVETQLVDLGFCLWQAGRPAQPVYELDLRRVGSIVAGYAEVRPLSPSAVAVLVGAIKARGLQLMVRSSLRGPRDLRCPLGLIDWIDRHTAAIEECVRRAIQR